MTPEPVQTEISNEAELHRYCRRCRRKLKAEKAMRLGYGAVCLKKVVHEKN